MPEKVKMFHKQLKEATVSVDELVKIQQDFLPITEWTSKERNDYYKDRHAEKKRMMISF